MVKNSNFFKRSIYSFSTIYSYFCALGYDVIAEDTTNYGKIDMTIKMPDKIIIVEFKLSKFGNAVDAIKQIKDKNYPQKYMHENKSIHLIGMIINNM